MASALLSYLQNLWPLSFFKEDDLRTSAKLVQKLSIPEQTKQFVFAAREPNSDGVVYILAAQNLSEQSALDVDYLIKEVHPKAVVAQIAPAAIADLQTEEKCLANSQTSSVPASPFEVLKRCIRDKINKDQYVKIAACQVLQEIFGVGFYGHFLAAKRAAEQTNSSFLLLESPYDRDCNVSEEDDANSMDESSALQLQTSCLIPGSATSIMSTCIRKICLTGALQGQIVKSLTPSLDILMSKAGFADSGLEPAECKPVSGYEVPPFAQSVYPLLSDLYNIFGDIPSMGKAIASAQKMLSRIHEGEPVSSKMLSDVYTFRIAIEGLRIGLNNAARCRIDRSEKEASTKANFSDLPSEEKCHVLLVQALRSQVREFGSLVAIVDARCLAGIRRHWDTPVSPEVAHLASSCFSRYGEYDDSDNYEQSLVDNIEKKRILAEKPMVAVGAGATAILGASSLSKAVHASSFFKLAAYKVPVVLKHSLMQMQRNAAVGLSKIFVPSKLLSPGIASAGTKTSTLKLTASAEKIRAVTHSVISSAERTSLMAMRTAFYEIMQKRRSQPFRMTPWATFGCSMAACAGLLMHGDGIECAAESVPSVPMIASLGRGLESLRLTSQEVRHTSGHKIEEALQALMSHLKSRK